MTPKLSEDEFFMEQAQQDNVVQMNAENREIELIDFSLESFAETTLAEKIEQLIGLAEGINSPETHWPLFWKVFQGLSTTPDYPCDRDVIAKTLIQAYQRLAPGQQYVICDFYFAPQMQKVLGWWIADWQKQVLKLIVNMPSQIWDFQAVQVREKENMEYAQLVDARIARKMNKAKSSDQLLLHS